MTDRYDHVAPTNNRQVDAHVISIIMEELATFVGPIAVILMDEHRDNIEPLDTLLSQLSTKLGSAKQVEEFERNVRRRLR